MNRENILKVADAIESHSIPDLGFNMSLWIDRKPGPEDDRSGHNCGTTACIAGWAVAVMNGGVIPEVGVPIQDDAEKYFGLNWTDGEDLFVNWVGKSPTPAEAVIVLRHLAETGEVDWDRALKAGA